MTLLILTISPTPSYPPWPCHFLPSPFSLSFPHSLPPTLPPSLLSFLLPHFPLSSGMDNGVERYEPLPRWGHASVAIGNKVYMWGGRTEDFSDDRKKKVAEMSVCLPVCLSVCLCLSVRLSVCLCLSVCLSACLFVCLSVYLSVCLSICLVQKEA